MSQSDSSDPSCKSAKSISEKFIPVEREVQTWVEDVVIGLNLCPFARPSWSKGNWRISSVAGDDHIKLIEDALTSIKDCVEDMRSSDNENLLLLFPECGDDFLPFLNLCSIIEIELDILGYLNEVQMVVFHPHFRFEGEDVDARGNYVNRSPYPMIHLLKKSSMDAVVEKFGESIGEEVSLKNNEVLCGLSDEDFEKKVLRFFKESSWKMKE